MKILFIITQSELGGAQRFLLEFVPYLASRGHDVSITAGEGDEELFSKIRSTKREIRNKFSPYGRCPKVTKIQIYKIQNLIRKLNPIRDFLALLSIFKIITKEKPDVLFLQSTKAGFLGSLAAKLYLILNTKYKIRVIYRIGGWSFRDPRPWWMNKILFWMEKLSAPLKDKIIVNSGLDRQIAIEMGIAPPDKIVKIYNGIDADKLEFLSKEEALNKITNKSPSSASPSHEASELHSKAMADKQNTNSLPTEDRPKGDESQTVLIGTIANLYATKGLEYLVEAAHMLVTNVGNVGSAFGLVGNGDSNTPTLQHSNIPTFVVIGEGPERPKLETLIQKYNLEKNFFLLGSISDARKYLKAFDIFVLPSVKEGFPWVLLEAMAAGLPIVATKVGAVPETIEDGKDGLLAPAGNSKALAEKISQITHKIHDREIYGENAKKKLEQFSLKKMLEESEHAIFNV